MDLNLPPEILNLAKSSPWVIVTCWTISQLRELVLPIACILALRLARDEKERAAFLKLFLMARCPLSHWFGKKRNEGICNK